MRTVSIVLLVSLAFSVDAVAKKKVAIALGGFSCTGEELEAMAVSAKVEFVPVQDPAVLENLGRCDKAKCWKKIARKLKADVVIFGTVAADATRALWLEPRLGEPDVLLEVGEVSPCELLAGWLKRLERNYPCHDKKCDAKKCLRHVYDDVTSFGSEPLWKSTRLATDGVCREITSELEELCDPISCECLMKNSSLLVGILGAVGQCETQKRLIRLKVSARGPADEGL